MGDKIAIAKVLKKQRKDRTTSLMRIGFTVQKYNEDQMRAQNGEFGSGIISGGQPQAMIQPNLPGAKVVDRQDINVGDVILHPSPKYHGGEILSIKPPKEGNEERGPRYVVGFKDGHQLGMYLRGDREWQVVPGGDPRTGAIAKPGEINKPAAEKPVAEAQPESVGKPATSEKEYADSRTMYAKDMQPGDRYKVYVHDAQGNPIPNPDNNGFKYEMREVVSLKPVPGGNREVTYKNADGTTSKETVGTKDTLSVQAQFSKMPSAEDRLIPTVEIMMPNGERVGPQWRELNDVAVGDHLVTGFGMQGDVVGIRNLGQGRLAYYYRNETGQIKMHSYTQKERIEGSVKLSRPLDPKQYAEYQKLAADKILAKKIEEEVKAKKAAEAAAKAAEAKIAREKAMAGEIERRTKESQAFQALVDDKIASAPPASYGTAGDTRNGGWGMTNAEFASRVANGLENATYTKVKVGGMINDGTYVVKLSDGTDAFAKKIKDGYREIANEVMGSLLAQRIGLGAAATLPAYIGSNKIITDPTKLPAGKQFNGVLMQKIQSDTGESVPYAHVAGQQGMAIDPVQAQKMALFDALVGNPDNHDENYMVHPTQGIINYDNGFAFGQPKNKIYENTQAASIANLAVKFSQDLSAKNVNNLIPSGELKVSGYQSQALARAYTLPIMTDSTKNADGSVTLTPTPFAASLRDNVAAAVADFQRSYSNPSLNVEMTNALSGISAPATIAVDDQIRATGSGASMLAAALNRMMDPAAINAVAENALSKGSVKISDPSNVFSNTTTKSLTTTVTKIKIGSLSSGGHR